MQIFYRFKIVFNFNQHNVTVLDNEEIYRKRNVLEMYHIVNNEGSINFEYDTDDLFLKTLIVNYLSHNTWESTSIQQLVVSVKHCRFIKI